MSTNQPQPNRPQPRLPDPFQSPYPPKKSHTLRTVLIVLASVFTALVIGVVSCTAIVGSAIDDATDSPAGVTSPAAETPDTGPSPEPVITPTNKPSASKPVEQAPKVACADQEDRNAPCVVSVGKPFQLGSHTVLAGWKVTDEYGTMTITGKAKNTGDEASTMFIEVKFLSGDEVLANVTCTTDALEPGQTQAMSCFSGEKYTKKYQRVTVEASF